MTDQSTADAKKIAYKTELLLKIGLAAGLASAFGPRVHMVKTAGRLGRSHRIQCVDGSWIEIDPETRRVVRTWGSGHTAREMAEAVAGDATDLPEHLEEEGGAVSAPGAPIRSTPVLSDDKLKTLADGWRQRGYSDLIEDERGVWVALPDGTRLHDVGQRVHIHGPRTDAALAAIAEKARDDWNCALALRGPGRDWPEADKARLWLACQREGVEYAGYQPSAALVAKWEAEQAATARGAGAALRPDDAALEPASAGPVPFANNGGGDVAGAEPEPEAPTDEPDLSAFDRQVASLDRRLVDLETRQRLTIKERVDAFQRTERLDLRAAQARAFEEQEQLRRAEAKIAEAREILARARALAVEKGLDYESAIAVAKAEHLAEADHGYDRKAGPRR